ncbi:LA_2444/LA_4059 family outer membrane protein [Leptospira johnsonii]|uniref:Outer membrane protein n=1 Tax=Leptospira johnsonii TaxID=1917820 RepID=A0A2P2D5S5_9LEPT|nr:LA_2444/LA_4059 family outer membrane protein [Leptospira johnsonii]GBF39955.1 outer membrane protein [Leptospira johnsonii]
MQTFLKLSASIFLGIFLFVSGPVYPQGKLPDPEALEKEADELEYQAGKSQVQAERRRLALLAAEKRKQAADVRNELHDRELSKPYDRPTLDIQFAALQSTWESEVLARQKNIGVNNYNTILSASGAYQNAQTTAAGAGVNPNLLNDSITSYSSPQGNTKTAFPIKLSYLNTAKTFGIEFNYLDLKIRPSYTTVDTASVLSALAPVQYHSVQYRRLDYSLNFAWYMQTATGRIGLALGARNLDIISSEYGVIPGNYGFGKSEEKAGGLGPQIGIRIFKNFNAFLLGHFKADYFRTLGHYDRNTQGVLNGIAGPYILNTAPLGGLKENLLSRTGYEIDVGVSLLRSRWLKYTLGFQYTELISKVSGYNYNPNVLPGSPGDVLFLNQVSKPLDQISTGSALRKEVHDKFYGIYLSLTLTI